MTCFNECFLFYVITERHYNSKTKLIKFVIVNFGKILCDCSAFFFTNDFLFAQNLSGSMFLLTCGKTEFL